MEIASGTNEATSTYNSHPIMPWQVKLNDQYPIVEQHISGHDDDEEVRKSYFELIRLALESKRNLFLGDVTQYERNVGTDEQFLRAESLAEVSPEVLRGVRAGLIIKDDPKVRQSYKLWVSLMRNRGINFELFTNREETIRWLMQQD